MRQSATIFGLLAMAYRSLTPISGPGVKGDRRPELAPKREATAV